MGAFPVCCENNDTFIRSAKFFQDTVPSSGCMWCRVQVCCGMCIYVSLKSKISRTLVTVFQRLDNKIGWILLWRFRFPKELSTCARHETDCDTWSLIVLQVQFISYPATEDKTMQNNSKTVSVVVIDKDWTMIGKIDEAVVKKRS